MTREEIIEGVKGCVGMYYGFRCGECPYGPYSSDCVASLHRDVERLMEAQEPRVLTLNEIPEHDGAVFIEYDPEDMPDEWMLFYAEHKPYLEFVNAREGRVYLATGTYNNIWRAWTSKPSAEQREATPWEVAP